MLESLTDLASASPWTYAVVLAFAALDAVVMVVPSETVLVAAASLAAAGELELPAVIAAAGAGALLGDVGAYSVGRSLGPGLRRRFEGGTLVRRLDWAEQQLDRRGSTLILVARFVPGGRTATMLTAGAVGLTWRRFLAYDAAAAAIWACYGGLIGFLGGRTFEDEAWKGLVLALGLAFTLALALEGVRRVLSGRRGGPTALPCDAEPQ